MLAPNHKTPTALGISNIEFESLVKVLGMLKRGEIESKEFCMGTFHPECGSACCIAGWAGIVTPGIFSRFRFSGDDTALGRLFYPGRDRCCEAYDASPAQGAIALRSYLTHGEPRWDEALEEV